MSKRADVVFKGKDDVKLVGDAWGSDNAPTIVFLHGGGQTRHSWGDTAQRLAEIGWRTLTLDQRGHGDSGWAPTGLYDIDDYVEDFRRVCSQLEQPPVLVGASLGGIVGLLSQGELSVRLKAIVLVDIALTVQQEGTNRIDSFMQGSPQGFETLDEAADAVAKYLPHRPRPKNLNGLQKNLRLRSDGRWYWHWDPKILNDAFRKGANSTERLREAAKKLRVPTLLVRGKLSDVLSEDAVQEFRECVAHARYVDVAGAGHMVAGDNNDVFAAAVEAFLDDLTVTR